MLKLGAAILTAKTATFAVPDINVILNLSTLLGLAAGLFWFGPRYYKTRDLQAQLAAKDDVIATDGQTIEALTQRAAAREVDLKGAQERAGNLEERNRKLSDSAQYLQGKYEEQSRYTAKEALETLQRILTHNEDEAQRRHDEMLTALQGLTDPNRRPQP